MVWNEKTINVCINNSNTRCVQAKKKMVTRDNVFICIISVLWLLLDILTCFVVGKSTTPQTDAQYLTTQTWLFGFLAKIMLMRQLSMQAQTPQVSSISTMRWLYNNVYWIIFILYGALQTAVLLTFFALLAMNSTLLREAMQMYSISVIITWNHLRHVTPVFFYIMLTQFLAPRMKTWYMTDNPAASNDGGGRLDHYKCIVANLVVVTALFMGTLHHLVFPDEELYKYQHGHPHVGRNCALVFAISVILATYYFVYGLL